MKELEERLRERAIFADTNAWTTSEVVLLSDALAIVAEYHSESTEITGTYPELRDPTKGQSYDLVIKDGSISSAPGTISFGSENLRYHRDIDTGAKTAADAPRIYRGEEIRDAPDGLYAFPSLFKPRSVLVWRLDEVVGMMNAEPTAYPWAFGPLPDWLVFDIPTNSPSEGNG